MGGSIGAFGRPGRLRGPNLGHLRTRKHDRTKGGGEGGPPIAARASSSVRRPLIAKSRNRERTAKPRRRPLAPRRPLVRSLPADGAFRGFLFLSRFRDSASTHSTLTPCPTHRKPARHRPLRLFVFSCALFSGPNPKVRIERRRPANPSHPPPLRPDSGPPPWPRTAPGPRGSGGSGCSASSPGRLPRRTMR